MLSSLQNGLQPWLKKDRPGKTNVREQARQTPSDPSKLVEWYQPTVKSLPADTVELFENYVGIKGQDAIKKHIYQIRDVAWKVLPYPCIGLFRFLDFSIHLSPDYPSVVKRVQDGATLLDLGCCFGQDLRKVAYDAQVSRNLIGTDLEKAFLHLGYDLFADRDHLEATFLPGDIFAPDFLQQYRGKVDIIYLGSFLHLFNETQQKKVAKQLRLLLRPQAGSMVFGRNLGADKGGHFHMESLGWDLYRHDPQTIEDFFRAAFNEPDEAAHDRPGKSGVPEQERVQWKVTSSLSRYASAAWDDSRRGWQGDETKQMMFSAVRL